MNIRRLLAMAALLLTLVSGGNALAFYSPSTGRWLSRDPIEGPNPEPEYAFVENNPTGGIDKLGLHHWVWDNRGFELWDMPRFTPNGAIFGETTWTFSAAATVYPVRHCMFMLLTSGTGWVKYGAVRDHKLHEQKHVGIVEQRWANLRNMAVSYEGIYGSGEKASCYANVIGNTMLDFFITLARALNAKLDCEEYREGDVMKEFACRAYDRLMPEALSKSKQLQTELEACGTLF